MRLGGFQDCPGVLHSPPHRVGRSASSRSELAGWGLALLVHEGGWQVVKVGRGFRFIPPERVVMRRSLTRSALGRNLT